MWLSRSVPCVTWQAAEPVAATLPPLLTLPALPLPETRPLLGCFREAQQSSHVTSILPSSHTACALWGAAAPGLDKRLACFVVLTKS